MSATINTKKLELKKVDSAKEKKQKVEGANAFTVLQQFTDEYEAVYRKHYLVSSIFRLTWFMSFLVLVSIGFYAIRNPELLSKIEPWTFILSLIPLIISFSFIIFSDNKFYFYQDFREEINRLENSIVKEKLNEKFSSDQKLRDSVEDFYIEINSLTKAKYETALDFFSKEYIIYIVISLVIAVIFNLRILW